MTDKFLVTKLRAPPLRPALVPRERLLARLDRIQACQVGLVSAPAGFGKTTLVAAWAASCRLPVAWLSLDEGDNDPARFLAYMVAAVQHVQPNVGASMLASLQAPRLQPLPSLLLPLINEIDGAEADLVLVLDDYHLIEVQAVHDALTFLIDHQPARLHIVLATRADPPLPIARLRGRGQLVELRQADLRFTRDETEAFLRQASSSPLSAGHIEELAERTEGWPAGLQMAAASLQSTADVDTFVRAFAGTHRHILDYLGEEILQRQPPEVQRFLLLTSILARLCAPLCDAVLDEGPRTKDEGQTFVLRPSSSVLEELDRANLFISPLDEQREWYRYHPLFADLLRQRLHQTQPELVPVLHRRASQWYESQELLNEAIDHALAAGDDARAASLVERAAPTAWKQGGIVTLWHWIEALPESTVRARPALCLYRALVPLLSATSLSQTETWLAAASAADSEGKFQGEAAVLGSLVAMSRGDLAAGLRLAEEAGRRLPETSPFQGLARRGLSALYLLRGEFAQAAAILEADLRASQQSGDRLGAAVALRRLGSVYLMGGQLRAARDFYQHSVDTSVDSGGRRWPVAGRALMHLAELSYEWNDLGAAEQHLAEGMPLSAQIAPIWNTNAYLTLAQVRQALGDEAGACAAMEQARQLAAQSDTELDDRLVEADAARLALAQGQVAAAEAWAAKREPQGVHRPSRDVDSLLTTVWAPELEATVLARLHLAQGLPAQAHAVLAPLREVAEHQGRRRSVIEILALQALASEAAGNREAAVETIDRALALAEPEGYVRLFLDEGEPMAHLLRQVSGANRAYAERLLAALPRCDEAPPTAEPEAAAAAQGPALPSEPLTGRELDILRLIAGGLSNREIGARLFLAPGTVKSYTYRLYDKLGVHSRTQAIVRARSLGLLPQP